MRKSLLASAAVLGGLFYSGFASAQSVTIPALQGDARGLAGGVNPADSLLPSPGSVVVRLGGQVNWYAVTESNSADRTTSRVAGVAPTVRAKEASYSFGDYIRLFPSVDGVAANGLRYGAFSEFRIENYYGTGGGANGSVSGIDRSTALYARRAWGYLGLANVGTVRFGTGDGIGQLFDTGSFQNFDTGGWNGDPNGLIDGNATPTFPFQGGVGAFYATNKLTFLSPQVYGLEFGVSYEPNTSNVTDYGSSGNAGTLGPNGGTGVASPLASGSSVAGDLARRRNTINPGVRYRNVFGPVGVAAEASYQKSATLGYEGVPTSSLIKYKGWDYGNYGLVLTFGGLSVGGQIMEGEFSGQGGLEKQGNKNSFAYIAGTSYTVGPVIIGASFFQYNFSNHTSYLNRSIGEERDRGAAAGGTYTLTPGVSLFLSYLYGDKLENGYDLINGAANTAATGKVGNATRAEMLATGIQIKW